VKIGNYEKGDGRKKRGLGIHRNAHRRGQLDVKTKKTIGSNSRVFESMSGIQPVTPSSLRKSKECHRWISGGLARNLLDPKRVPALPRTRPRASYLWQESLLLQRERVIETREESLVRRSKRWGGGPTGSRKLERKGHPLIEGRLLLLQHTKPASGREVATEGGACVLLNFRVSGVEVHPQKK